MEIWQKIRKMGVRIRLFVSRVVIAGCFSDRKLETEKKVEFNRDKYVYADAITGMEKDICQKYGCYYEPNRQIDIKPNMTPPYWDNTNHPNKAGNAFVAKRILQQLQLALRQ
jgi:hypothetical protein